MKNYQLYLGGRFTTSGKQMEVRNPFNDEVVAQVEIAGRPELEQAILMAQAVKQELAQWPSYERYHVLMQIVTELQKDKNRLSEVLSMESGKPMRYAAAEIDRSIQTFTVAAEECKRLPKEYMSLDWTLNGKGREGLVNYFPIGIVAGISPFNFPMNLAVHKIAPAIAAGCPLILKPASATPLSTLELAKIIDNTSLPKGALSILPMDRKTGQLLVEDNRIALLSFTGSPEVGWQMKKDCGKKKVVLELGGNAAVIVTESSNLQNAVEKCVTGGFAYSGQICIHAQRIYIHEKVFSEFTKLFVQKVSALRYGNPVHLETEVSVMIDEANAIRVEQWVNEALNNGAKLLCGGKRTGSYVEPTVLTGTNSSMLVNKEEVFGPVVCLESYSTIGDAVEQVNDTRFGLQCGLFTNLLSEMDYCFNSVEVGGLIINDVPTLRFDHMPYGGIKDSGLGREGVKYAILDMLEPRILVK